MKRALVAKLAGALIMMLLVGSPVTAGTQPEGPPHKALSASNPSEKGTFDVLTLTYGSGTDQHRPEFGQGANLRTPTVDGSAFLEGWTGKQGATREKYWGFGRNNLTLNGVCGTRREKDPFPWSWWCTATTAFLSSQLWP